MVHGRDKMSASAAPGLGRTATPFLLAFVNSKSGGQKGTLVHTALSGILWNGRHDEAPLPPEYPLKKGPWPPFTKEKYHGKVIDLATMHDPAGAIREKLAVFPTLRLLVCGGDGTICWVLDAVSSLEIAEPEDTPAIAVMPLGTGNDLSRTYGWGGGFSRKQITRRHVWAVLHADVEDLDLWEMTVSMPRDAVSEEVRKWLPPGLHPVEGGSGSGGGGGGGAGVVEAAEAGGETKAAEADGGAAESKSIELTAVNPAASETATGNDTNIADTVSASLNQTYTGTFCNYFSIGMTARGAMAFHKEREAHPARFTSPLKNKVIYAQKGCGMICGDIMCHPTVAGRVAVQVLSAAAGAALTDVEVAGDLCEINVLNIQSYSGGVIKTPTFQQQSRASRSDGLLEIAGLGNYVGTSCCVSFGRMCCQSPMRRVAQGAGVRIAVNGEGNGKPLIAQFDGEPFILPPGSTVEMRLKKFRGRMLSVRK